MWSTGFNVFDTVNKIEVLSVVEIKIAALKFTLLLGQLYVLYFKIAKFC